ncbi:MAG: hypothetical protein ACFFD9_08710 [Candidatus Thorarchaeota archaeon]
MVESDVRAPDDQKKRVHWPLLLILSALFAPFVFGYQYLEWFHSSSSHMTWFIAIGFGSIENSDWTGGTWFLRTIFSSGGLDPFAALAFYAILLFPRLLFAATTSMHCIDRLSKAYVVASAIPVVAVTAWLGLQLMTASIILGSPPGVLISIAAPDVDSRLFLPTPILLLLGYIIIRSKE